MDFGVAGAPPLPREGETRLIHAGREQVIRTSDPGTFVPPLGEALVESEGRRRPLPDGVYARRMSSVSDSNKPVVRHCAFFGDEDAADAAGPAPGSEDSKMARGVAAAERQALIALYEATGGPRWAHRVGWLGPPGTECSWHGVRCDLRSDEPTVVTGLELFEDGLVGAVPEGVAQLTHLEDLILVGNRLTGRLPQALLQRWLDGELEIAAEAALVTDVSEIALESSSSLLCGGRWITLRSDETATVRETRCRNRTPDDRETYCEVKRGRLPPGEFGRLALLLERDGFLRLQPEYTRNVSHGGRDVLRVTRAGAVRQVENYATAGPVELWSMQRAVEGVAAGAEWESTTEEPECVPSSRTPSSD